MMAMGTYINCCRYALLIAICRNKINYCTHCVLLTFSRTLLALCMCVDLIGGGLSACSPSASCLFVHRVHIPILLVCVACACLCCARLFGWRGSL